MSTLAANHPASFALMLAVAALAAGCQTSPSGYAGLRLVTPLKAEAAVCLAETDPEGLKRILGNDAMIKSQRK